MLLLKVFMDAKEMFHVSPDFLGLIPLIRHQFGSKARYQPL